MIKLSPVAAALALKLLSSSAYANEFEFKGIVCNKPGVAAELATEIYQGVSLQEILEKFQDRCAATEELPGFNNMVSKVRKYSPLSLPNREGQIYEIEMKAETQGGMKTTRENLKNIPVKIPSKLYTFIVGQEEAGERKEASIEH